MYKELILLKSTGVIRRIDELGRVVIPKEIRRNLGIRNGDQLEVLIDNNRIVMNKFDNVLEYSKVVFDIVSKFCDNYSINVIVSDREKVVFSNNLRFKDSILDKNLISCVQERINCFNKEKIDVVFNDSIISGYYFIMPIITSLDCLGLLIIYSENEISKEYVAIMKFISSLIASKFDIN